MAFMGRTELVIGRGNPFGLRARTMSSDILVKDAGAAALLDWPNSFYRIAELVGSSRKEHRGLKRFGYLHRFAAASGSRSFGPSLQEAYRRFLTKSQGMKEESLPDFLARPEGGAYITSGESDRLLGGVICAPGARSSRQRLARDHHASASHASRIRRHPSSSCSSEAANETRKHGDVPYASP